MNSQVISPSEYFPRSETSDNTVIMMALETSVDPVCLRMLVLGALMAMCATQEGNRAMPKNRRLSMLIALHQNMMVRVASFFLFKGYGREYIHDALEIIHAAEKIFSEGYLDKTQHERWRKEMDVWRGRSILFT